MIQVSTPPRQGANTHAARGALGGEARCLATRGTHRSHHHPGSRCPALVAAAVPQGPVLLHAGHTGRPHPPLVRLRGTGSGSRLTITTQRNREEASPTPSSSGPSTS